VELEIRPEPSEEEREAIAAVLAGGLQAPPALPWRDETDEP
jgi:hypothetical protein